MSKQDTISYVGLLGAFAFSLCSFFIVDYFNLFEPFYFDIAFMNKLNDFSIHGYFLSFLWITHVTMTPFVFLYFMVFLPVNTKAAKGLSFKKGIMFIITLILIYMSMLYLTGLTEDTRDKFDSILAFYLFFLTPLIAIPCLAAQMCKNFSKLKFLYRV